MPKKEIRCEHPYYEWDTEGRLAKKSCPHPYFGPGKHPETGEEIDCCIFHASIEEKKDYLGLFWFKFWRLFARAKRAAEIAKTEEEKKNVWLECYGFVFQDTGDRFTNRKFPFRVNMRDARYLGAAGFTNARFSGGANFERTKFLSDADFSLTKFPGIANFRGVRFSGIANFWGVQFPGDADFTFAKFEENTTFRLGSTTGTVRFKENEFFKDSDFRAVCTDKRELEGGLRGPGTVVFDHAYFHLPDRVPIGGNVDLGREEIRIMDLSRWSFRGTNIEKVRFVGPCWPAKKERKGRKKTLDEERAEKGEISWAEAGEVYRKLRKNFEDNLAYEAAGDFHIGQMECRLRDRNRKIWDRGLTLAYKLVSGYGESVGRPFWWLLVFFALFTGLFLINGFPAADGSAVDWAWGFNGIFSGEWWGQLWQGISFTLRSSVSFAVPRYAEGVDAKVGATLPALMFFWKAFAVTIVTFFVLALRRRFKR
jgi:hypothetical protein